MRFIAWHFIWISYFYLTILFGQYIRFWLNKKNPIHFFSVLNHCMKKKWEIKFFYYNYIFNYLIILVDLLHNRFTAILSKLNNSHLISVHLTNKFNVCVKSNIIYRFAQQSKRMNSENANLPQIYLMNIKYIKFHLIWTLKIKHNVIKK